MDDLTKTLIEEKAAAIKERDNALEEVKLLRLAQGGKYFEAELREIKTWGDYDDNLQQLLKDSLSKKALIETQKWKINALEGKVKRLRDEIDKAAEADAYFKTLLNRDLGRYCCDDDRCCRHCIMCQGGELRL